MVNASDPEYRQKSIPSVAMLLSNSFLPDPRVQKEANSLTQAGYNVRIICWDRQADLPAQEEIDGYVVHRLAIRSQYSAGSRQILYLPRFWFQALRELYKMRPNIVHCHDLDTAPVGYWYSMMRRTPWIFDAHECYPEQMRAQVNHFIYRFLGYLEKAMIQHSSQVITVGELLAQRFRKFGGDVSVVGNYQPLQNFNDSPTISRSDCGLDSDDYVIAYIGGFSRARAILPLIEASKELENVRVLLIGDGPQRNAVESALPSHPNVRYIGWIPQDQVPAYTMMADVIYYGLSNDSGNNLYSSPNALFNALAAGKPILTTNMGEIAHIVRQERCGIVIERPIPEQIARAIEIMRDPDTRLRFARCARRAAEASYNWQAAESALLTVYGNLKTKA